MLKNEFTPDYCTAPGETITEILADRHIPAEAFTAMTRWSAEETRGLLAGETLLTPEIAQILERVLGPSADFWNRYEARYREFLAVGRVS